MHASLGELTFMLFVWNFQIKLKALGTLADSANIQYLHMLLCGEVLRQLDTFSVELGSTTTTYLNQITLGLGTYFPTIDTLSKQKRAMRCVMRKPRRSKVRCYAARMICLNEYLTDLKGAK